MGIENLSKYGFAGSMRLWVGVEKLLVLNLTICFRLNFLNKF